MSTHDHRNAAKQKLLEAIRAGDLQRAAACVARGVSPDAIHLGLCMLDHAIAQPELIRGRMVPFLLGAGANPNLSKFVCSAAAVGDAGVVTMLLDAGASPDGRSEECNPLAVASELGHVAVVDVLLSRGADVYGRQVMYLSGRRRVTGCTPLMMAAAAGHERIVRRLLDAGADAGAKDSDGRTALGWAEMDKRGRTNGAREILEAVR